METTINATALFLILGSFLGLILAPFLLIVKSAKNRANILLGLAVLAFSLYIIPGFLSIIGLIEYFPHFIGLGALSGFFLGPVIYFYVQSCTQKGFQIKSIHLIHFIPWLIDFGLNIPTFVRNSTEKIEAMKYTFETGMMAQPKLMISIKIIHIVAYFFFSVKTVLKYRKHQGDVTSFIDKSFHRWLLFFCSTLLIPFVIRILYIIANQPIGMLPVLVFSVFLSLFSILMAALFKPKIFHSFPNRVPVYNIQREEKKKYASSNLSDTQKEKIAAKLTQFMQKEKPYQAPEVTLNQLAEKVNIPAGQLSQIINERMNCTFIDFINQHRIEEAKKYLHDEKFSHFTVEGIAYEVGFNSRSAFYSAFKKHANTTPSAYKKRLKTAA